ncbi:SMEK domain-containing protein (plasmid) [Rhizobium sophoriradicis]|uniref:SMEK domain-containing protein n=1 Tax=Rhizobium sophoriradicis TaxID=1535245 RepID=UPI001610624D|nr:SMEK domain-containing protein [Rhizobium leguminosarum bv. phaseoli]
MNRDDYLNSSAKYLGRLTHEIRALNAIGRFDINSVTEDFLVPVLKVLFDAPNLQNQNEIQQNFPSIDLGCQTSRISFQITTDASSDKVVKTLQKFREHQLERIFDRVFVLTITEKQSSYTAKTLNEAIAALPVSFSVLENILDITDILKHLQGLETAKLERIEFYLSAEFRKRDEHLQFRDQLDKFLEYSTAKIEVEKKSKKYIPSIFVETHATKEETRLFSNPIFFYRKVQDGLKRLNYTHLNSLLRLAREPELGLEFDNGLLTASPRTIPELREWIDAIEGAIGNELQKIGPMSWRSADYGGKYRPSNEDSANWSLARHKLEVTCTGVILELEDARSQLKLIQNKIFLVTSMAGQGKTNFVCDLVDNQFKAFEIPSIFIPARELNTYPARQRLIGFISNNRYIPQYSRIHQYFDLFNSVALESKKPFIIVIDGINEVNALEEFNDELKDFCNAACQYELIKIVITCRSEFFDEKYSSILNEPFSDKIRRVTDLRSEMSDLSKGRLLRSYLKHFHVAGKFARPAREFLQNDLLLLRIFCERHEGLDVGHLSDIYKGDLFEDFLLKKIESFPERLQGKALPTLLKIASSMLAAKQYSTLSVRNFEDDERDIRPTLSGR